MGGDGRRLKLVTKTESERLERRHETMILSLNGISLGLRVLSTVVPVSGQRFFFKAKLADFS